MGEDESILEIESIREELEDILKDSPLLVEIGDLLDKRDAISIEIDQRSVSVLRYNLELDVNFLLGITL